MCYQAGATPSGCGMFLKARFPKAVGSSVVDIRFCSFEQPPPSHAEPFQTLSCQRGAQLEAADAPSAGLQRAVGGEAVYDSASSSHTDG